MLVLAVQSKWISITKTGILKENLYYAIIAHNYIRSYTLREVNDILKQTYVIHLGFNTSIFSMCFVDG